MQSKKLQAKDAPEWANELLTRIYEMTDAIRERLDDHEHRLRELEKKSA